IFHGALPGEKIVTNKISTRAFDRESHPGISPIQVEEDKLSSIRGESWIAFKDFDFEQGANKVIMEAATPGPGGTVELRIDSENGPLIASLEIENTGSWTNYIRHDARVDDAITGVHDLYLKFVDTFNNEVMFETRNFWLIRERNDRTQYHREF
ncbi:MAG: carbohydrate-binding protein, partial [Planctomycetes bacterium]|nr:carbohydrate-binding protein [Planctomycetota bacterium]